MALRRLKKELVDIQKDPLYRATAGPIKGNMLNWQAVLFGEDDTPYEGGKFKLDIDLANYPQRPPKIKFLTKIYHPNINSNGEFCDVFYQQWSPALTISSILLIIFSLINNPDTEFPYEHAIAEIYKNNRPQYDANTRLWTRKYAL